MPYNKCVVCLVVTGLLLGSLIVTGSIALGVQNHTKIALSLFLTGWIFIIFSLCFCQHYALEPVQYTSPAIEEVRHANEIRRIAAIQQRPLPPIPMENGAMNNALHVAPPTPQMRLLQTSSPRMRSNVVPSQLNNLRFCSNRQVPSPTGNYRNQFGTRYTVHNALNNAR